MRLGWAALAVGLAGLLTGCGDGRREIFAQCHMDALRVYARTVDAQVAYNQVADFTLLCMETKRYELNWERCPSGSGLTAADRATQEDCYDKLSFWHAVEDRLTHI